MAGSLEGPRKKLWRADHHFTAVAGVPRLPLPASNHPLRVEADADGLEYRFYLGEVEPLRPDLPLVIGDCLFNARAALDQLIFQLHVLKYDGTVPDDAREQSAFPLRMTKPKVVDTTKWPSICRLPDDQRAAIEELQPYNAPNDPWAPGTLDRVRGHLAMLHRLNIIDKHRELHVVRHAIFGMSSPATLDEYGFRSESFFGPMETGAEVQRWTFTRCPPDIARHVEVNSYVSSHVLLDEPSEPLNNKKHPSRPRHRPRLRRHGHLAVRRVAPRARDQSRAATPVVDESALTCGSRPDLTRVRLFVSAHSPQGPPRS